MTDCLICREEMPPSRGLNALTCSRRCAGIFERVRMKTTKPLYEKIRRLTQKITKLERKIKRLENNRRKNIGKK